MKILKLALPLVLTVALIACLNWNYIGRIWSLISSAALNMASGRVVSTSTLQTELNSFSLDKLIRFDISDFELEDFFEQKSDDEQTNED